MLSRSSLIRSRHADLPDFLLPAFRHGPPAQPFSSTRRAPSRVGAMPIAVPDDVTLTYRGPPPLRRGEQRRFEPPGTVEIAGPLGQLSVPIPPYMTFAHDAAAKRATLSIPDKEFRPHREMWGTTRGLLNNNVLGVSEGHSAILRFVGVGFRASLEATAQTRKPEYRGQQFVSLKVGYSHPIEEPVPRGVTVTSPQPTRLLLEGADKAVVTQFAARLRRWRPPEPYKGKGIFVNGETIKLKAKKIS